MNFLLVTNERLLKSNKNDTLTKILSRNSYFDYWVALLKNRHHTENFYNKRKYRIVGTRVKHSKSRLALSRDPCLFCCGRVTRLGVGYCKVFTPKTQFKFIYHQAIKCNFQRFQRVVSLLSVNRC